MHTLFPPIEPYSTAWLDVGDDHRLYFEVSGNPSGYPVVFLHGGPGSSCNPGHRRFFDPAAYRIVLVDQRGCGRSTPGGETQENTTAHLIMDLERLRQHVGVERWLVFGGSWGSTLALAYAQAHPGRVSGLVLRGLFLASADEVAWYLEGLRRFVPEAWEALRAGVPRTDTQGLIAHYYERVSGGDRAAAQRWNAYESFIMGVGETPAGGSPPASEGLVSRVRIQLHYLRHACFLAPAQLLDAVHVIAQLPAILVQGRRDLVCPPATAYTLAQAWPRARLQIVEEGGHSPMHPAMISALVGATEEMKVRVMP